MTNPTGIVISGDFLNPAMRITTWILLALTTLTYFFRLVAKFAVKTTVTRSFAEEFLIGFAALLGLGESITFLIPPGIIFGSHLRDVSNDLQAGLKAGYAGLLLFILTLGTAKLSVCACFHTISPDGAYRRTIQVTFFVLMLWILSSFFAAAFQCGTNGPWDPSARCIDQLAFLRYIGISNILTDAALVVIPVTMVYPLKSSLQKRVAVTMIFSLRILVIIATGFQMAYLPRLFEDDFTLRAFPYWVCMQFVQFTSIFSACSTYSLPLLRNLQTGRLWANITPEYALSNISTMKRSTVPGTLSAAMSEESGGRSRRNCTRLSVEHAGNVDFGEEERDHGLGADGPGHAGV